MRHCDRSLKIRLSLKAPSIGVFLFPGVFALYLLTLAPTVTFWDSGELIAASWGLGIPHQPGYPLFCLIGRFFTLVPFGSVAYRLNLLSAFFSAFTVYVVYQTLLVVTRTPDDKDRVALSLALAVMLAAVRVFWAEAVVTEVYALNSLFISLLVMLYARAASGRLYCVRYIPFSGFLFGLAVINHMSAVLYLPTLTLTWALLPWQSPVCGRIKHILTAVAFIMFGLSVYLYLPIRAQAGPALDLGHPDSWRQFWWAVKWGEYIRQGRGVLRLVWAVIGSIDVAAPRFYLGAPAAAFFAWRLLRRNLRLYLPLIVFALVYALGISTQVLGGEEEKRFGLAAKFYIPAFIMFIVLAGGAAGDLLNYSGGRRAYQALVLFFFLCVPVLVYKNYRSNDYSRNFIAYDYAVNSLNSAGEGGVYFTWGDNGVFPLWYVQQVERRRDDVALIHSPLMTYGWYLNDVQRMLKTPVPFTKPYFLGENVFRIVKAVRPVRSVAYDYSSTRFLELDLTRLRARGLAYFEGEAPKGDPWPFYVFRGVKDSTLFKGPMEQNIIAIYKFQKEKERDSSLRSE